MEFHYGKLRVACQLIKSFVMPYGRIVSYTCDGYHQKMFEMSEMQKMSDKHTPKPETKLKQFYANQKDSSKGILLFSRKVIRKYSGHMFIVSLKLKPAVYLFYRMKRIKLQQNLTTRKTRIFFKNNLLLFLQKNRILKCQFSIKRLK